MIIINKKLTTLSLLFGNLIVSNSIKASEENIQEEAFIVENEELVGNLEEVANNFQEEDRREEGSPIILEEISPIIVEEISPIIVEEGANNFQEEEGSPNTILPEQEKFE